jgi:RND family efflux transporter MFP subunit
MIGVVRIALRRPYTFVVLALLILIVGPLAALRTPIDIFPDIRIPVIAVIWQYTGLQPDQMAGRMTTQFQRALTTLEANFAFAQNLLRRLRRVPGIADPRIQQSINSTGFNVDVDRTRSADFSNKQNLVKSAQAILERLHVLEGYKRIVAPFDGLVTTRTTDVGALIGAGGGGPPLFVISDTSKLRVYVNVPQNYVPSVRIGTRAQLSVPEYPGRTFSAMVEASAKAVDVASGTTRMQLVVDNAAGALMTGGFANVKLELDYPDVAISVPASALIFDRSGLRVATVGPDNRVVLKPVTISRDFGKEVEIASGLAPDDRIIESPPDGIASGDAVRTKRRHQLDEMAFL